MSSKNKVHVWSCSRFRARGYFQLGHLDFALHFVTSYVVVCTRRVIVVLKS